jgi:hypothetical protein
VKELAVQEAALAWAQGKRLEAKHKTLLCGEWTTVEPAGKECFHTYSAGVFGDCAHKYQFRLASELPVKKWRPWTVEEVPFGSLLRTKGGQFIHMIVAFNTAPNEVYAGQSWVADVKYCLDNAEHSTDGGKTWLPCGVEVTE